MTDLNYPLHPANGWIGITVQQYAAIALKVEMSGIPELDAMIRESRRLDMATAAMRDTTTPEWCLLKADALLSASGKEKP